MSIHSEIRDLRERYATALDAIQHQRMVIDRLESLLWTKMRTQPLHRDAAVQVEAFGDSNESVYLASVMLQVREMRARDRRAAAKNASGVVVEEMEHAVSALRRDAADLVPAGAVVDGILKNHSGAVSQVPSAVPK